MAKKNQFNQPQSPPPPLFINSPERDFNKQVVSEVAERVINNPILYYPIDLDATEYHPLYGEAINKSFLPPIKVNAFVDFRSLSTKVDKYGLEKEITIKVHFHSRRLTEDQDLFVREGDFILHTGILFEIVKLEEQSSPYGQHENIVDITANCVRSRKGLFNAQ